MPPDVAARLASPALAELCRHHHILRLSLFGSVLTPRFNDSSDLDILVEFEPGHVPGLLTLSALQRRLSELAGRSVDLRTPAELSPYFRHEVLASAAVQYESPR